MSRRRNLPTHGDNIHALRQITAFLAYPRQKHAKGFCNSSLIRPVCEEYEGSENNGVMSGSFAAFAGSYQVSAFRLPPR